MDENTHYLKLCAAYVRGMAARNGTLELPASLTYPELSALALEAQADIVERGRAAGLKLHRFKRTTQLSRVRRVLGALRELAPENLLDVGSGRGVFLWPLLDAFPDLSVVSIDILDHRVAAIRAVIAGGWDSLQAASMDVTELDFDDGQFSVVTMLEVIEQIELFREIAYEENCINNPRLFASDHARVLYFRDRWNTPDFAPHHDPVCCETLMSGLPGSGKNTWIAQHANDQPVVSLDTIRKQHRVRPEDNAENLGN